MQPFFAPLTKGAVMADDEERERNPRAASVRLRAVELVRPVPQRWRRRFEHEADGSMQRAGARHGATGRRRGKRG